MIRGTCGRGNQRNPESSIQYPEETIIHHAEGPEYFRIAVWNFFWILNSLTESNNKMPLELLIIADDLTGAADTAAQFAKQGIGTAIALSCEDDIGKFGDDISVVAVDTESRHLPPALAFERVTKVVANGVATGCNRFYKKLDSTFRGNIGSELEALMQAAGARQLMLVPAYPKAGRKGTNEEETE